MNEAFFYNRINDDVQCLLCPHKCLVKPGKRGVCGVRENSKGSLVSLVWEMLSAVNSDPIEKKPLFHFFPGTEILSLGSVGCSFSCLYCQNFNIAHPNDKEMVRRSVITPDQIINQLTKSQCGVAFTYNEPVVWYEYMVTCAEKVKNAGKKTVMVSNGYINSEPLDQLISLMDAFSIDLKAFNNRFYQDICRGSLEPVKSTLVQIAHSSSHLEVEYLVIPGLNDDRAEFKSMLTWYADYLGKEVPLHINRYFPHYKMNRPMTPEKTLNELFEMANEQLDYVYVGNIRVDWGQDTICPACQNKIIQREGRNIYILNHSTRCLNCGTQLNLVMPGEE